MKTILYHNQNCSKSRAVFDLLSELAPEMEIINYLENPPNSEELKNMLSLLNIPAKDLVRKNEPVFIEHFDKNQLSEDEWIEAMIKYPILIERPIVVHGSKAAIGRPIERVLDLFAQV